MGIKIKNYSRVFCQFFNPIFDGYYLQIGAMLHY